MIVDIRVGITHHYIKKPKQKQKSSQQLQMIDYDKNDVDIGTHIDDSDDDVILTIVFEF